MPPGVDLARNPLWANLHYMKNKMNLFAAAILGAAFTLAIGAASSSTPPQAYEYKVIYGEGTNPDWKKEFSSLTKAGSDGWELVALQEHREGGMGNSYWDAVCSVATYTFKRPFPSSV